MLIIIGNDTVMVMDKYYHRMSEIENKVEPLASLSHRSRIRVLGKHGLATSTQSHAYPEILLSDATMGVYCPELETKPQQYTPCAKRIFVEGNLIAIIDWFDNLWFISELFPTHLNLSLMLYRKVRGVFIGENQCLISNKKSPIILNWGAKKILDVSNFEQVKLSERNTRNVNGYFTAHQTNFHRDDKFLYSLSKKVDNSNKLYHVRVQTNNETDEKNKHNKNGRNRLKHCNSINNNETSGQVKQSYSLVAYPLHETHTMKHKVSGVSVGKFHCMCWDVSGLLYTWGNRSIALGYDQLPHQKISATPQPVRKLNKFVTSAFAATHYSLALTSDGHIYEWGIKKESNQINQQLIFEPKILKIDENQSKVILMKGRNDQFACLNSKHQLFIWGERAAKFLTPSMQSKTNFKNGFIFSPFLVPHFERQSIVDFGIGEDFIAVLIPDSKEVVMSEDQKVYWDDMIKKVKKKLKIGTSVKTQAAETLKQNESLSAHKFRNSESDASAVGQLQIFQANPFQSIVEKSYNERHLKKSYFQSLKNQDKFFASLFKPCKQSILASVNQNRVYNYQKENHKEDIHKNLFSYQDKKGFLKISLSETKRKFQKQLQKSVSEFKAKTNLHNLNDKNKLSLTLRKNGSGIFSPSRPNKYHAKLNLEQAMEHSRVSQLKKTKMQSYSERLQKVQHKKKSLQETFNQQVTQRVRQNSIEYRMDKHEKIILAKIHEKNKNLLKHTVQAFFIKQYLARLMIAPIQMARQIKICQFAKNLHLSRIEKNLRTIFVKARVKHRLKKLRKYNFATYALLCTIFKNFVKKRRQGKAKQMRKIVAQQLYKNVLREKIRFGLSKSHLNTRKLQKFREWLVMTKIERIKCLKTLWKNHLLSIMKVSNDSDSIPINKNQQNSTFESLYKQKVTANPMLKLETFLNKTPIFQLRYEYFQSIIFLFRKENKTKSQKLLKGIKCASRKRPRIKFIGESGDIEATINSGIQNSTDIMPYSMHYNLLVRPKSMEINIPESMKKNERWVHEEVLIFEKCLRQIIQTHEINFLKARRKYDIDLAYYIREKYDSLAEKRWKCIVEYNQIKITPQKKKKQKELFRIFDLVGMQKVLAEDCLPEKYLMLEEAVKKRDAPLVPSPFISFGINQFKEIFKKYYDSISLRAKQIRKNFV